MTLKCGRRKNENKIKMINMKFSIDNDDFIIPIEIDDDDVTAASEVVNEYLQQYLFKFNTPQIKKEIISKISEDNFIQYLIAKNISIRRDKKINQILK